MIMIEAGQQRGSIRIISDTKVEEFPAKENFYTTLDFEEIAKDKNGNHYTRKARFFGFISYNHGQWFVRIDEYMKFFCYYFDDYEFNKFGTIMMDCNGLWTNKNGRE